MQCSSVFNSVLVQVKKGRHYLTVVCLVADFNASVPQVAARQDDSWMALELLNALLMSILWPHVYANRLRWEQWSVHSRCSHPKPKKAENLVQPNKKLFAAYKSIFCDILSSHSVLSWKRQTDVCFALSLKDSLLGHITSFLTEFLIHPSLLCAKQNKTIVLSYGNV